MLRHSTTRLVARSWRQQQQQTWSPLAKSFSTTRPARELLGEGNSELFEKHVVKGDRLTVVDFHAVRRGFGLYAQCWTVLSVHPLTLHALALSSSCTRTIQDWCPPCKMLDPILTKAMKGEDEADLLKINTDNETDIAAKYKVSATCRIGFL